VKSDIAIGIYNIFAENNIQIPFPQLDLHVMKEEQEKEEKEEKKEKKQVKPKQKPKTGKTKASGPVEEPGLDNDNETGPVK